MPAEEPATSLKGTGLPEPMVQMVASLEVSTAEGWPAATANDVSRLAGRPTTPLRDTLAAALDS